MWWLLLLVLIIVIAIIVYSRFIGSNVVSTGNIPIWSANIEKETLENPDWRKVLTTSDNLQFVAMNTPPGESLGWEVHADNDQFFRIESGECELSVAPQCKDVGAPTLPTVQTVKLTDGMSAVVPKGVCHNVMNTGKAPLRMYTIYGPPHHPPGTVDRTHEDERMRESAQ